MDKSRPRAVPGSRLVRAARFGGLAAGLAGRVAFGGALSLSTGRRADWRSLALTPGNLGRFADELARMRGAAMKVGQLISMDAGAVLPPELAEVMARLRADADFMPPRQLKSVLTANWGEGWLSRFASFDVRPIAAASIGQVHRARTKDGRDLAIKVQYPGVRRSIDGDVANVAALIRLSGLAPPGLALGPMLDEARRQLHDEADYALEAAHLDRFGALLAGAPGLRLPQVQRDLSTRDILAMTFLEGTPVEDLAGAPQALRDEVIHRLTALFLEELFGFGLVQTDANFANFRWDAAGGDLVLLDFGATRAIPAPLVAAFRRLLRAGLDGDAAGMTAAAAEVGYIDPRGPPEVTAAITAMMTMAFDELGRPGPIDVAASDLPDRMQSAALRLAEARATPPLPPVDALLIQRKIGGLYLLAARLRARIDVRPMLVARVREGAGGGIA